MCIRDRCDTDPDSPWSSWRGGLCERTGPSLYGGSSRIEQEDFPKKKKSLRGTLENSPAAAVPVSSPPGHPPVWGRCTLTGECVHLILEGTETTGRNQGV